jgi:hypothetical protein
MYLKLITMKKVTICFMLIVFSLGSFCQQTQPSTNSTGEEYLKKSKRQKTTGLILLLCGAATGATGIITALAKNEIGFLYLGVLGGGGMIIASVPFLNASARNKEKAKDASLSFKLEQTQSIQQSQIGFHSFPVLSLKLNL